MTALAHWHARFFLVAAIGLLAIELVGVSPTLTQQAAILGVLVTILGLPHGALDPAIAQAAGLWRTMRELSVFLGLYVSAVALSIIVWIVIPSWALSVFLAMSAWHFSGDWQGRLPIATRLLAGAAIISVPALAHPDEVDRLFSVLVPASGASMITGILAAAALPTMAFCGLTVIRVPRVDLVAVAEVATVLLLALALPPLVFFVAYFCFLHSPRHLIESAARLRVRTWRRLLMITLPITAVTVLGAIAFVPLLPTASFSDAVVQIVFVGLAALTVPHMVLIEFVTRLRSRSRL